MNKKNEQPLIKKYKKLWINWKDILFSLWVIYLFLLSILNLYLGGTTGILPLLDLSWSEEPTKFSVGIVIYVGLLLVSFKYLVIIFKFFKIRLAGKKNNEIAEALLISLTQFFLYFVRLISYYFIIITAVLFLIFFFLYVFFNIINP